MFIDIVKIKVKSGDGGNGAISFHREKYVANGGPDGGDGGKGGDVVFVVDDNVSTLSDFRYKKNYIADSGKPGGTNNRSGKSAEDLIIKVPKGTLVKDADTKKIICDLSEIKRFVIAFGGKGGKGNSHFANSTRQAPNFAKPGFPGKSLDVILELKLIADVGLVGYPNVGKSTFISVVSEAKPKIANYHFTTLTPVLGVVSIDQTNSFVIADIPGLIEGAGDGVGLGHKFLRHVERCRLIVHIVDVSGSEGRDPIRDFETINAELYKFNKDLSERPQIVLGNKLDITYDQETLDRFKAYIESKGMAFFAISAFTKLGVREALFKIYNELSKLPPVRVYESEYEVSDFNENDISFEFTKKSGVFEIECDFVQNIMQTMDINNYDSLKYFQKVLERIGIASKLEQEGVKEGDTVIINGWEFDYFK